MENKRKIRSVLVRGAPRAEERAPFPPRLLLQVRVLFGLVNGPKFLHILLDVLLRLVFHVLVALEVFRVFAVLQLLVHDSVGQLRERKRGNREGGLRRL